MRRKITRKKQQVKKYAAAENIELMERYKSEKEAHIKEKRELEVELECLEAKEKKAKKDQKRYFRKTKTKENVGPTVLQRIKHEKVHLSTTPPAVGKRKAIPLVEGQSKLNIFFKKKKVSFSVKPTVDCAKDGLDLQIYHEEG